MKRDDETGSLTDRNDDEPNQVEMRRRRGRKRRRGRGARGGNEFYITLDVCDDL